MSCLNNNDFINVSGIGQSYLINQLEDNLKSYLDNGFLKIGAFVNIKTPTSGINNIGYHKLYPTEVPGYSNYKVWQSAKKDWVWETGVSYNGISPTVISGININNTFYSAPTGSGNYSYNTNYALGRITFDQPLPSGTNIQVDYSYRWCQVYKSSNCGWWKELQKATLENNQITKTDKGDFSIGAEHRIQTPCVIIEPVAGSKLIPHALGSTIFRIEQDILFHIFTENISHKNDILDIIRLQNNKLLYFYDINKIHNVYGLNHNGYPISSGLKYDDIINNNNYSWNSCYFKDINTVDMETANFNFSWCTLRVTSEIIV